MRAPSTFGRIIAAWILAIGAVMVANLAVVSAAPGPTIDGARSAVAVSILGPTSVTPDGSPAPCSDDARRTTGQRWQSTYRWRYHAASTPDEVTRTDTKAALVRAVANITGSDNDCGLADLVSATADFRGVTDRRPNVTATGQCGQRDERNTIGFGRLPLSVAAATCWFSIGDRIIEADMRLNSRYEWTTTLAGCTNELMIEAVATHEAGHVFGLRHVGEANHGRLTMSTRLDGACQNSESSLGRGDVRGLRALY